jgi:hypothetical protein
MPANVVSSWPKGPPPAKAKSASLPGWKSGGKWLGSKSLDAAGPSVQIGSVAELYSFEKMLWMLYQDTEMLRPLLAEKLRSV